MAEKAEFPVIVLLDGEDGSGRGEMVNRLLERMDPRHIRVHAGGAASEAERRRPPMWRFWRDLPPEGKTGIFFGGGYADPIERRVAGRIGAPSLPDKSTKSPASSGCWSTRARSTLRLQRSVPGKVALGLAR